MEPTAAPARALSLAGVLMGVFLAALDVTIVATALPVIASDLDAIASYAWVASAYLLTSSVLVPLYGRAADAFGPKPVLLLAIAIFLLGSAACGAAGLAGRLPLLGDGMTQLVAARALQGVGGAGLFSLSSIVIASLVPPRRRGTYQGYVGAAIGTATVVGPWLGGVLTDHAGSLVPGLAGWRWVFLVNVPIAASAFAFVAARMPDLRRAGARRRTDAWTAVLLVAGLASLVFAIQLDKVAYPWAGRVTLTLLAASLMLAAAFVARSARVANPVLDLRMFRERAFATATLAGFFGGAALTTTILFLPLFLENVMGVSPTRAGAALFPLSLATVLAAIASGQYAARTGRYKAPMVLGAAVWAVGAALLSGLAPDVSWSRLTVGMAVAGVGLGAGLPMFTLAAQNAVDHDVVGQATSTSQFARQFGGMLASAAMGTVLATSLTGALEASALAAGGPALASAAVPTTELGPHDAAGLAARIRSELEDHLDELTDALRADDRAAFERRLATGPLPPHLQERVRERAVAAPGDERRIEVFELQMRTRLDAAAEELETAAAAAVRRAFATAVADVFRALVGVAALGLLAVLCVPGQELRATFARAS